MCCDVILHAEAGLRSLPRVLITTENNIKYLHLGQFWGPQIKAIRSPCLDQKESPVCGIQPGPVLPPSVLDSSGPTLETSNSSREELGPDRRGIQRERVTWQLGQRLAELIATSLNPNPPHNGESWAASLHWDRHFEAGTDYLEPGASAPSLWPTTSLLDRESPNPDPWTNCERARLVNRVGGRCSCFCLSGWGAGG